MELRRHARRYCAMALGKETDPKAAQGLQDLDQIKADVVFPFLLETYTDYETGILTRDEVHEIVAMVTSYIFRRAVCRIPTNSLNKTFAGFGAAVRKDRYVESVKAHFIGLKVPRFSDRQRIRRSAQDQRPVQLPPFVLPSRAREPWAQGARHDRGLHDRAHHAPEREPFEGVADSPW